MHRQNSATIHELTRDTIINSIETGVSLVPPCLLLLHEITRDSYSWCCYCNCSQCCHSEVSSGSIGVSNPTIRKWTLLLFEWKKTIYMYIELVILLELWNVTVTVFLLLLGKFYVILLWINSYNRICQFFLDFARGWNTISLTFIQNKNNRNTNNWVISDERSSQELFRDV